MINTIRYSLLYVIIGLFAAAYLTWEPPTQNGTQPGLLTENSKIESLLDSWAEKVPSLKDEIHQLTEDITETLSEWKNNAVEQSSFFSGLSFDNFSADDNINESTESLTSLLTQLKEQFKDVNMEDIQERIQQLIEKAKSLPQTSIETTEEQPMEP